MNEVLISKRHLKRIIRYAARSAPLEVCGVLAGSHERISHIFSVPNMLQSASRFSMEPGKQLGVLRKLDRLGIDMVGFYHSHPNGPDRPSVTDCRLNLFPNIISLIVYFESDAWRVNAFLMQKHSYSPLLLIETFP